MRKRRQTRFNGLLLRRYRKDARLSRLRLAEKIAFRVGPSTIGRYEKGEAVPTVDVAVELARAVSHRLEDLIDAEG